MKAVMIVALILAVPSIALTETEAEALLRIQRRSAGIVEGLVDQTLEYQHGHTLRVEAVKQRERAIAERNERWKAEEEQYATQKASRLRDEDQSRIDSLNSDLRSKATEKGLTRSQREHASRALRDEQRQIYGKAGIEAPIAPEPPPQPIVHHDDPSQSPPQKNSPTVINRSGSGAINPETGEYLTPSGGGGYIGTRDGRYYAPAGPSGVIDTQTGRFIPNN